MATRGLVLLVPRLTGTASISVLRLCTRRVLTLGSSGFRSAVWCVNKAGKQCSGFVLLFPSLLPVRFMFGKTEAPKTRERHETTQLNRGRKEIGK